MLKIKESIDLKELEKYGFKYEKSFTPALDENNKIIREHRIYRGKETKKTYTKYVEVEGSYIKGIDEILYGCASEIIIDKKDRSIMIFSNDITINENNYDLDTLYDLIKADMVEKVEE